MKIFFILAILVTISSAKTYKKCELARKMYNAGFSKSSLPDWMCLVEAESEYDTKAKNTQNADGSTDWGIFQINDRYWCGPDKGCGVACKV